MGDVRLNPPETVQQEKPDYDAFVKQTYTTMHSAINQAMQHGGERSILTVIGEGHGTYIDPAYNNTDYSIENPAPFVAGAFAEVSALEASKRLFGAENTVLSVEMDVETLAETMEFLKDQDFVLGETDIEVTMMHAIVYAHNNNIEIVPNDFTHDMYDSDEERDVMMIDAIAALSRDDERKSVVHVGGAAHLSNMSGYTDKEIESSSGNLILDPKETPFYGVYEQTTFVNAFRFPEDWASDRFSAQINAEETYMTNPVNAIQIDPPGPINAEIMKNIVSMVEGAANDFALEESHKLLNVVNELEKDEVAPAWLKCGW